jgi:hypothetical protein
MGVDLQRQSEIPPAEIETGLGTVRVHVRSATLEMSCLQFYRMRPVAVVVTRADGREDRAEVSDIEGRVVRNLVMAGAGVTMLSCLLGSVISRLRKSK